MARIQLPHSLGAGLLGWLTTAFFAQLGITATPPPVTLRFDSTTNAPLQTELIAEARDRNFWQANAVEELARSARPWFGLCC